MAADYRQQDQQRVSSWASLTAPQALTETGTAVLSPQNLESEGPACPRTPAGRLTLLAEQRGWVESTPPLCFLFLDLSTAVLFFVQVSVNRVCLH